MRFRTPARLASLPFLDPLIRPLGIFRDPQLNRSGRWILYSALVGAVSGVGAIGFDLIFRLAQAALLHGIGGFRPPGSGIEGAPALGPEQLWRLPISLVIGGLIAGFLVFRFAPEAEGHGTDAVIRSFHHLGGAIRRRVPPVKAIASAVTIGSGGSAGREGPIAQIGAGFGSFLGDLLRLGPGDRRILMMAGAAGGIGAIFRAPLGAAMFAAEVLYWRADFEYEVLIPALISSITGYCLYSSYAGWGLLFNVPPMQFHEPRHLLVYLLLGALCALAGHLYPRVLYGMRDRVFRPLPVPSWLRPALGAALLAGVAVAFPPALGMGYGYIQEAIDGRHTILFLAGFALIKILATSLTISSGGSGGVFAPSLVIGGAIGGAFGLAVNTWLPGWAAAPAAYIMVGMGGFFAGVAKVPFAAVIMVMEMTGSYGLLVPSLLVAAIAVLLLPGRVRLYEHQLSSRVDSPAHAAAYAVDILRGTKVAEACQAPAPAARTVLFSSPLADVLEAGGEEENTIVPVIDAQGRLVGEVTPAEVRASGAVDAAGGPRRAEAAMRVPVGAVELGDDLAMAARLLAQRSTDGIAVVEDRAGMKVLGVLTRRDVLIAYERGVARILGKAAGDRAVGGPDPEPPSRSG